MPTATVTKTHLDAAKLRALSKDQRYVFALLGHVFNELMLLQKLATITRPLPSAEWHEKDAAAGTMMQVQKMLMGKVHEAMELLRKVSIAEVLKRDYFPLLPGLEEHWTETVRHHDSMTWLRTVRNSAAFHYMTSGQWSPHLTDEMCDDAHIIVGGSYGGTFYHWHEAVANYPILRLTNEKDPFAGLAHMVDEMISLTGELTDFLAHAVQRYIFVNLLGDPATTTTVTFDAPDIERHSMQLFFADGMGE